MASNEQKLAPASKPSKESDSLFDDDDGEEMDTDDTETIEPVIKVNNANQLAARRRLEEYLEQKRLRRELEDDFDF